MPSTSFLLTASHDTDSGNYTCRYLITIAGVEHLSAPSPALPITVIADTELRLADGPDSCSGQVEIRYNGTWGWVCNEGWDDSEVQVLCRQLGCGFPGGDVPTRNQNTIPTGNAMLTGLRCAGTESHLWVCPSLLSTNPISCDPDRSVYVTCSETPAKPSLIILRSAAVHVKGENVRMKCSTRFKYPDGNMSLHQAGQDQPVMVTHVEGTRYDVTFILNNINKTSAGSYFCIYQVDIGKIIFTSDPSDSLELAVLGEIFIHLLLASQVSLPLPLPLTLTPSCDPQVSIAQWLDPSPRKPEDRGLIPRRDRTGQNLRQVSLLHKDTHTTHIHTDTLIYTHTYRHTHTLIHTHMQTHTQTHSYTHTYRHTHALSHIYIQTHTCSLTRIHTDIHMFTHTHRDTHIWRHIHTQTQTHRYTHTPVYQQSGETCLSVNWPITFLG
uniref:Deleted in malignant brain tumors 1 protein-like n=1 Tax=Callorhinchus milii TaxID=7868 RepID=A0A4W3GY65_CALMI